MKMKRLNLLGLAIACGLGVTQLVIDFAQLEFRVRDFLMLRVRSHQQRKRQQSYRRQRRLERPR